MIYSADLRGHRQLYCDVFTDIFLYLGYDVLLVIGLEGDPYATKWRHIRRYLDHPNVTILDISQISARRANRLSIDEICHLQIDQAIAATLFACGDELKNEFAAISNGLAPALKGWNIGIFGWTDRWTAMESVFAPGIRLRERLSRARDRIGPLNSDKRFFEKLENKKVLDAILVKDERVAETRGQPFIWLPDIYRPFNWDEDQEMEAEYAQVVPAYQRFLAQQKGREILLYFGTAAEYKGYDILLRLAVEDNSTCFVHCGSNESMDRLDNDINAMRTTLTAQGRFFETRHRLESQKCIRVFFDSIQRFVSTHRVYVSSGTILQALESRKPVLVPNRGILRYRTIHHSTGRVYNPGSFRNLLSQWLQFKNEPADNYLEKIDAYMQSFAYEKLVEAVSRALGRA
jgi:hypothetical protein